eukprot:1604678-Rhodomonas_salina.1
MLSRTEAECVGPGRAAVRAGSVRGGLRVLAPAHRRADPAQRGLDLQGRPPLHVPPYLPQRRLFRAEGAVERA